MDAQLTTDAVTVPTPAGAGWPLRLLAALDRLVTGLLLAAVTVMVAVVSAQVLLRYGFNRSIDWADEIGRLAFVWAIFLAIPLGVRDGAHIGIDICWSRSCRRAGAAGCGAAAAACRP